MYVPWNTRQQEGRNVNEQILHNLGRIHGNGKEKAHKEMSELLERILSNDNMNIAYKRVCANKGAGGVDDVTVDQLGDYIKENWNGIREQIRQTASQTGRNTKAKRRSEKTRNPDRNGQGNSARYCTGD